MIYLSHAVYTIMTGFLFIKVAYGWSIVLFWVSLNIQ